MAFKIIAIIIMLEFYGCYFLKMLRQKKQGIETNQIGKGKTGLVKHIELTMKVATLLAPAAELVSIALGVSHLSLPLRILGAVLGAAGAAIFLTSVSTMRDSWRAGVSETDKTELVTDGIYKFSRNPAFLGFDLVYIGILLMFYSIPLLIFSAFAAVMLHLQIVNVEEPFLISAFGDSYVQYMKKTNRYLGTKKG